MRQIRSWVNFPDTAFVCVTKVWFDRVRENVA
jgi:hypothetical protein